MSYESESSSLPPELSLINSFFPLFSIEDSFHPTDKRKNISKWTSSKRLSVALFGSCLYEQVSQLAWVAIEIHFLETSWGWLWLSEKLQRWKLETCAEIPCGTEIIVKSWEHFTERPFVEWSSWWFAKGPSRKRVPCHKLETRCL